MIAFFYGCLLSSLIGWFSYAHRAYFIATMTLAAGVALVLAIAPVGPLVRHTAIIHDISITELLHRVYVGTVHPELHWLPMWTLLFALIGYIVTAVILKGIEPEEGDPKSREDYRRRVRAAMNYSDEYFD